MLGNMKDALLYLRVTFILRHDFAHNMEFSQDTVQVDEEGWATFPVSDGGLSVYVPSVARELLDYGQDKLTRPRN